MSKPARPGLKFSSLDELVADVDRLRAGPYERAGKWDLAMILDHLAKTMNGPFTKGTKNMPGPIASIVRFFYHRFANRETYPQVKIPALKFVRPTPGISVENAYSEIVKVVGQVNSATGDTIACPPIGNLRLDDFRKMQLLHGAHHLSFLKLR